MKTLCLFCGAEGEDDELPPGHEYLMACPERPETPCPKCGAGELPGDPCVLTGGPHRGWPTKPHRQRISPAEACDVLAPSSVGNVRDLAAARRARE